MIKNNAITNNASGPIMTASTTVEYNDFNGNGNYNNSKKPYKAKEAAA